MYSLNKHELRKMPATAAQLVPGFYRRRAMRGVRQGCLRYIQMEATLYVLPCAAPAAIAREHSRDGPRYVKETVSYKFQTVLNVTPQCTANCLL